MIETIAGIQAVLGEGPAWDGQREVLYMVDIIGQTIYEYDPHRETIHKTALNQMIGALVPRQAGGLLLALQHGFHTYDPDSGKLTAIHDPEQHLPGNRFNDGKCDPAGRFWAGTMSLTGESFQGALYRLDEDWNVSRMVESVSCSNGLAWSPDGGTFYYIDTPTREVAAFDYEAATGAISSRRVVIRLEQDQGLPDGMTIDEEGMLWIAHWGGARVSRWDPGSGRQLGQLELPVPLVTSCTFGGPNLDELYITSARVGMSEQELEEYPLAGSLFRTKPGVKGMRTIAFQG